MFLNIIIIFWTLSYKVCLFENQKVKPIIKKKTGQNLVTWKILLYDTFEHAIEQGHFAFMMSFLGFYHDIFR